MQTTSRDPLSAAQIDAHRLRQERLRSMMDASGMEAILISAEKNIRYLTGFVGHDSLFLLTADDAAIISDPRYDEFLAPWHDMDLGRPVMGVRHRLHETVGEICHRSRTKRLGIEADQVTLARAAVLREALAPVELIETDFLVGSLRMRKDAQEIDAIRRAVNIQQEALRAAMTRLEPGLSELQFGAIIEFEMKMRGAFGPSFDLIVGTGANSSVIHHVTGPDVIDRGVLLVDWGAVVDGYSSDMTRTFVLGEMPPKIREIYPVVMEAQLAAIDACAPGRTCAEIDAVARRIITDAGYGQYFGHGLGHGLGMNTHEPPFFNELQTDIVLEPGMVMTVEPGIYLPGIGGVRIEDVVVLTDRGVEVPGDWPKQLDEVIIESWPLGG